jgi:hypothetical protein
MTVASYRRRQKKTRDLLFIGALGLTGGLSAAAALLGTWADSNGGLAFDFTDITASQAYGSGKIIDGATPANNWQTTSSLTPFDKLTWTGASLRMCYGSDGVLRYAPHQVCRRTNAVTNWVAIGGGTPTFTFGATDPNFGSTAFSLTTDGAGRGIGIDCGGSWVTTAASEVWVRSTSGTVDGHLYAQGSSDTGRQAFTATTTWTRITGATSAAGNLRYIIIRLVSAGTIEFWRPWLYSTPMHTSSYIENSGVSEVFRPRIDYDPSTLAVRGLLVEEARTNLALRSQEFDNASWSKGTESSVTANQITSPDGTQNADLVTQLAGTNYVQQQVTVGTGTYTASVYAKAGTLTWLRVSIYDSAHREGFFNLSTGAVGTPDAGVTQSIQSVGSGWYRCIVTYTTAAINPYISVYGTTGDTGTDANPGTYYIWGAQLEAGAFATSLIPTTSASATRAADAVSLATSNFNASSTESTLYAYASTFGNNSVSPRMLCLQDGADNRFADLFFVPGTNARYHSDVSGEFVLGGNPTSHLTPNKYAAVSKSGDFAGCVAGGSVATDTDTGTLPPPTSLRIGDYANVQRLNGWMRQIMHLPRRLTNANLQTLTT